MNNELVTIAVMGMDQHENGAIAVSRILKEAQMGVSYLGRFQTPATVVDDAIAKQATVIGISCHSWEYMQLVPQLLEEIHRRNIDIPVVIGGSVITEDDAKKMQELGVAATFNSGSRDIDIVDCIRDLSK